MLRPAALLLVLAAIAFAFAPSARAADPGEYAARAVLVADGPTGEILYEEDADRRVAIASITKLMTALVTLERAKPAETVKVRSSAAAVGESTIGLESGERLRVRDLLAAALIQSANDAAFALAAHVGKGSVGRFVRLMNAKARELGLDDTSFTRPDGLDARGHYSTARDVLVLARAAMKEPVIRRLVRLRTAEIAGGRTLSTWNDLLGRFRGVLGVKTGHTDRADWCQVAAARRDGATVYAVVLGSPRRARRNEDLEELLEWGLDQYARVDVVSAGRSYATATVPFSDERVPLVAAGDARRAIPLWKSVVQRVVAPEVAPAPLEDGERVGEIQVLVGGRVVARKPLVAAEAVRDPGIAARARWYAGRTLDEAGSILDDVFGAIA